jgi:hypothetical protein
MRNDRINEPFEQEGRNQSQKASSRDREKTGQMPMDQRPNLFHQPDELGRQSKPQQSKPMRLSLVYVRRQREAARMSM